MNWLQFSLSYFQKDARNFQLVFLSSFLFYGLFQLNWDHDLPRIIAIVISCFLSQGIIIRWRNIPFNSFKSAGITALGLCLLLQTDNLWIAVLGGTLAIFSKTILRFKGRHYFNPANFGLMVTVLITQQAWVSPGQWGNETIMVFFFSAAALMVLLKVGRLDTSVIFLLILFLLEYFRTVIYLGWEPDVLIHQFTNGSLLLFIFFMITDPKTTPSSPGARLVWAALLAGLSFFITHWFYISAAPLWVLLFYAPITVLFNQYLPGEEFSWSQGFTSKIHIK